MEKNKLDIVVCGSGRPELLSYCIKSVRKFVMSQSQNTDFRIIVHEDFVNANSKKVVEWCRDNEIDEVVSTSPAKGYGKALDKILNQYVKSEYILNLQDDWEFERTGIDIDRILWTMKNHDIWTVIFNKMKNSQHTGDQFGKEFDFDGMKLSMTDSWRVIPAVCKTSIFKKNWEPWTSHPFAGKFIKKFGASHQRKDFKYSKENVRAYYFGGLKEPRWVRHLGNTWRARGVGGCIEADIRVLEKKPPWIPYYIRPMNKKWCNDPKKHNHELIMKILDNFPPEIRKEFI